MYGLHHQISPHFSTQPVNRKNQNQNKKQMRNKFFVHQSHFWICLMKQAINVSYKAQRCDSVGSKYPQKLWNFLKVCAFLFFCAGHNFLKTRNFSQNLWNQDISFKKIMSKKATKFFKTQIISPNFGFISK